MRPLECRFLILVVVLFLLIIIVTLSGNVLR